MDNITKKGTAAAPTEAAIVSLIGEYTESGFSVGDFCFLHDGLDEATFRAWLERYGPSEDDGFVIVRERERHLGKGIAGERILFLFFNRTRTHVKALLHEESGMTIFYHRLHGDNFQLPELAAGQKTVDMDPVMLLSLLRGMEMHRYRRTG